MWGILGCALTVVANLAAAAPRPGTDYLAGTVRIGDCSGSIVRWTTDDQARAVLLTNAHCLFFIPPGAHAVNRPGSWTPVLFNAEGGLHFERLGRTRLLYATMTDTDLALLELPWSYGELRGAGIPAFEIASQTARAGSDLILASGNERRVDVCRIDAIVDILRSDDPASHTFRKSYRLAGCSAAHGVSGSPLIVPGSRIVAGIENLRVDGQSCKDSFCELQTNGSFAFHARTTYGQRVDGIRRCLSASGQFDLDAASCDLPGGPAHAATTQGETP